MDVSRTIGKKIVILLRSTALGDVSMDLRYILLMMAESGSGPHRTRTLSRRLFYASIRAIAEMPDLFLAP